MTYVVDRDRPGMVHQNRAAAAAHKLCQACFVSPARSAEVAAEDSGALRIPLVSSGCVLEMAVQFRLWCGFYDHLALCG